MIHWRDRGDREAARALERYRLPLICGNAEQFSVLDAALRYYGFGWTVIPLRRGTKKPLVNWKRFRAARPSAARIAAWWKQWPDAAIGILAGRGLAILDVDEPDALCGRPIPPTPTVRTARGWHFYLEVPPPICTSLRIDGVGELLANNYAVAPPSLHESGAVRYAWADYLTPWDTPPALAPDWLLTMLQRANPGNHAPEGLWSSPTLIAAPRPCVSRLEAAGVPVGQRHEATMRVALDWRRRLCPELAQDDLYKMVLAKSLSFYRPLREPDQKDGSREVSQIVADAMAYKGKPHSCSDPFLRTRCTGKRSCPFYRAIEARARQAADLSLLPAELQG